MGTPTTPIRASVVIPTLNAGAELRQCLEMVFKQECDFPFEVIVIDSSSGDETLDIARQFPVRLYEIQQKDFNHGLTRQQGVDLAAGEYVAFLTQDAIPADTQWLAALVRNLEVDEKVAGVYSRQLPKANCDPIAARSLTGWLSGAPERRVTEIASRAQYDELSPWEKRVLINFDDVSSCVRKRVMQDFPYANVPFGEDLEWSQRVIEAGYRIVYEPASRVYHSHPTSIRTNYRRAFIDHKMMKERLNVEFSTQIHRSARDFIVKGARHQIELDWAAIRQSDRGAFSKLWWMAYAVPLEILERVGCLRGARSARWVRPNTRGKRIVLVSHDFPPEHFGGVGVYTYTLAKALSQHHDVSVFYRRWDGTRPDYSVDHGSYDGIPVTIVNHNFTAKGNSLMLYDDPNVDDAFRQFLARSGPDLVHFQFLGTGLSTGMAEVAESMGIPTLLTLNDYWFLCPRGQMMNYRWQLCSHVDVSVCAQCVFNPQDPLAKFEDARFRGPSIDLTNAGAIAQAKIEAPDPNFVRPGGFVVNGGAKGVLIEHPPAEVGYRVRLPPRSTLRFSLALAPDTWEQEGEGVQFDVRVGRAEQEPVSVFSHYLDPKHVPGDRAWHDFSVDLTPFGGETVALFFTTKAGPSGSNAYCTAGWGDLRVYVDSEADLQQSGLQPWATVTDQTRFFLRRVQRSLKAKWRDPAALRESARRLYREMTGTSTAQQEIVTRLTRMRQVLNGIDVILAPSQFLRQMYVGFGIAAERIRYSDYGMNTTAIRKSLRTPSGRPVFGYIGTLLPTKGVHVLVDAFLKVPPERAELRIYGPPANKYIRDYAQMIERKIGERTDIRLMGEYQPQAIGDILAGLDAIVVPSIWHENSPLTIHEAFIAGAPVLTSNIGGMAELVTDGVNGLHFKVGDADDLASKLMRLIDNPAMFRELSARTPSIKSIEENAAELEVMYEELLSARGA